MSASKPILPEHIDVVIESLDEQGRATYITGHFELNGTRLRFDAIGVEGYGGPNIAATLPDETLDLLQKMGYDHEKVDELVTVLQREIMEGQARVELRKGPG